MANMFLLPYSFLDQEHLVLVERKKTKSGIQYHLTLLSEHLFDGFMKTLVVKADSITFPRSKEIRNTMDAIKIALYNETRTGHYN